jgi:hypothetical protein
MTRGPRTRALTPEQIKRLEKFRRAQHDGASCGYSLPQLRSAMGMPFGFRTLGKALEGRPVLDLHHSRIVEWIERYLPALPPVIDWKAAAAGERPELGEEPAETVDNAEGRETDERDETKAGTTRTVRGSR